MTRPTTLHTLLRIEAMMIAENHGMRFNDLWKKIDKFEGDLEEEKGRRERLEKFLEVEYVDRKFYKKIKK